MECKRIQYNFFFAFCRDMSRSQSLRTIETTHHQLNPEYISIFSSSFIVNYDPHVMGTYSNNSATYLHRQNYRVARDVETETLAR